MYIAEAHAADEWPINSTRCNGPANTLQAPTTLDERKAAARRMSAALALGGGGAGGEDGGMRVFSDDLDDAFLSAFAAWPIRLFGVRRDGTLGAIAQPEHAAFRLPPLRDWLLAECAGT